MNPLYLAAGASFLAGLVGYIIVRLWLIPIGRYRRTRREIAEQVASYLTHLEQERAGSSKEEPDRTALRSAAVRLKDLLDLDLPPWYRMVLNHRSEAPETAAMHLMKLADTRRIDHAEKRARQVLEALRLSSG